MRKITQKNLILIPTKQAFKILIDLRKQKSGKLKIIVLSFDFYVMCIFSNVLKAATI